jgi:hypothetical protein
MIFYVPPFYRDFNNQAMDIVFHEISYGLQKPAFPLCLYSIS